MKRLAPLRLRAHCPKCGRPPLDAVEPWVRLLFRGVEAERVVRWVKCGAPGCATRYAIRAGDYQHARARDAA